MGREGANLVLTEVSEDTWRAWDGAGSSVAVTKDNASRRFLPDSAVIRFLSCLWRWRMKWTRFGCVDFKQTFWSLIASALLHIGSFLLWYLVCWPWNLIELLKITLLFWFLTAYFSYKNWLCMSSKVSKCKARTFSKWHLSLFFVTNMEWHD